MAAEPITDTESGEDAPYQCVAVLTNREARDLAYIFARQGVPCRVTDEAGNPARKASARRYHVAIRGGLTANPAAYFAILRGEPLSIHSCEPISDGRSHAQDWTVQS